MTLLGHNLIEHGAQTKRAYPLLNAMLALRMTVALILLNMVLTGWIAASHLEPFADLATYYEAAQNIAQGKGYSLDIKIVANASRTDAPFPVATGSFTRCSSRQSLSSLAIRWPSPTSSRLYR